MQKPKSTHFSKSYVLSFLLSFSFYLPIPSDTSQFLPNPICPKPFRPNFGQCKPILSQFIPPWLISPNLSQFVQGIWDKMTKFPSDIFKVTFCTEPDHIHTPSTDQTCIPIHDLITKLNFNRIMKGFHKTFATGLACRCCIVAFPP